MIYNLKPLRGIRPHPFVLLLPLILVLLKVMRDEWNEERMVIATIDDCNIMSSIVAMTDGSLWEPS